MREQVLRALAATLLATSADAAPMTASQAQAPEIAKRAIAFRSVVGPDNQTPQLAAYLKSVLIAGGFADGTDLSK